MHNILSTQEVGLCAQLHMCRQEVKLLGPCYISEPQGSAYLCRSSAEITSVDSGGLPWVLMVLSQALSH